MLWTDESYTVERLTEYTHWIREMELGMYSLVSPSWWWVKAEAEPTEGIVRF